MKRKKLLPFIALAMLTVLALVYAIGQGKKYQPAISSDQEKVIDSNEPEEQSIPTNDDPWKEIEKLVNAYYNKQGTNYSGTMKLIDDNGSSEKVLEVQKFDCTLLNDDYYYSVGSMEMINKKNYIVAIDHQNKSIAISPNQASDNKQAFFNINEFKKLLQDRKASAKVTQLGDQKILTIDNIEDPTIQGYSIYYSPETYRIQKILIGMIRLSPLDDGEENYTDDISDKQDKNAITENNNTSGQETENSSTEIEGYYYYLEINYTSIKTLSSKEKEFSPENKFLLISKDRVELTEAFSSYELSSGMPGSNKSDE